LIPFVGQKYDFIEALDYSIYRGFGEITEILIPFTNCDQLLDSLYERGDFKAARFLNVAQSKLCKEELNATTVQVLPSFKQCVEQAKSDSEGAVAVQKIQVRRL
ncbi:hypothetical protein, partial [Stenotrophomonas maltophilia]